MLYCRQSNHLRERHRRQPVLTHRPIRSWRISWTQNMSGTHNPLRGMLVHSTLLEQHFCACPKVSKLYIKTCRKHCNCNFFVLHRWHIHTQPFWAWALHNESLLQLIWVLYVKNSTSKHSTSRVEWYSTHLNIRHLKSGFIWLLVCKFLQTSVKCHIILCYARVK